MYKPIRKKKFHIIPWIISASGLLLLFLLYFSYSRLPAKVKKTDANLLTAEGWLSTPTLEKVKN